MEIKMKKYISKWRESTRFINKGHQAFCEKQESLALTKPIVSLKAEVSHYIKIFRHGKLKKETNKYVAFWPRDLDNYLLKHAINKNMDTDLSLSTLENDIDPVWIRKTNDYLSTLSQEDIYTLKGHTYFGHGIANTFLKNMMTEAYFKEHRGQVLLDSGLFPNVLPV